MCPSSGWPRGSPQLASRPAHPSRPLRAGAHGVTRRGARGPGRGAGESQPERAGRCGRGRAGKEVRAEGAERAEPPGEEEDGEGGPAPASRSPLIAAAEPAHFAFRLWTAAGLRAPGTGQTCPRRLG